MEKPKLSGQPNITLATENRVYLCKEEHNLPQRKTQAALFSSVLPPLLIYSSICTYYVASQVIVLHGHSISSIISFKRQDQVLCILPGYHTACYQVTIICLENKGIKVWMESSAPSLEKVWDMQVNTHRPMIKYCHESDKVYPVLWPPNLEIKNSLSVSHTHTHTQGHTANFLG